MNWYKENIKTSWDHGIPIMDEYSEGRLPASAEHKKDPRSLVTPNPIWGGKTRKEYPRDISLTEDYEPEVDEPTIPSSTPIIDSGIPTGEGANDERFVSETDKMPIKTEPDPIGPHNMHNVLNNKDIFNSVSKRTKMKKFRF
jgi:hypothetical protein